MWIVMNKRKNKRDLLIASSLLTSFIIILSQPAHAFKQEDVDRLLETGACKNCDLSGANLEGMDLKYISAGGSSLRNANLSNTDLRGANLYKTDLQSADLSGAKFYSDGLGVNSTAFKSHNAFLAKANFQDANMTGADLRNVIITKANLKRVNLYKANLQHARLEEVNLSQANLQKANLSWAKLEKTDLRGAQLKGANMINTFLYAAILDEAGVIYARNAGAQFAVDDRKDCCD